MTSSQRCLLYNPVQITVFSTAITSFCFIVFTEFNIMQNYIAVFNLYYIFSIRIWIIVCECLHLCFKWMRYSMTVNFILFKCISYIFLRNHKLNRVWMIINQVKRNPILAIEWRRFIQMETEGYLAYSNVIIKVLYEWDLIPYYAKIMPTTQGSVFS
jgi:hypothetical protein